MSLFLPFEPNRFFVNAFTVGNVGPRDVSTDDILDNVEARRQQIAVDPQFAIPAGGGRTHPVTLADVNAAVNVLRDPTRRAAEELLVPAAHPPQALAGVAEFQSRHRLGPRSADPLLSTAPLDATRLVVQALPAVPPDRLVVEVAGLEPARLPPAPVPLGHALARAKDRRGTV